MSEERRLPVNTVRCEVGIPGYEGWWAEFTDDITVDEIEVLETPTDFKRVKQILAKYTSDWNFVDKRGKPLPKPKNNAKAFGKLTATLLFWCVANLIKASVEGLPFRKAKEIGSPSPSGKRES